MLRTCFPLLLVIICFHAEAQTIYPKFEEVVDRFFDIYSIKDLASSEHIRFEKRPGGWQVAVVDYAGEDPDTVNNELFWNRNRNKFQRLDFPKLKKRKKGIPGNPGYTYESTKRFYTLCPYYGYPGWDRDVILEFENEPNLQDSTLYALARAYSSYASNLLNDNSGYSDPRYRFNLPGGKNSLTPGQLAEFRFYQHKAIEKFEQLSKRNPDFETIVGKIGVKASNEYLASFLLLRIYQNEEEAQKELVDGLYSSFQIATAKNYLASCERNAILFTNGDNDTYPLLYVQSALGFRSDVLVVNLSLLQTSRYINSLRAPDWHASGLSFELTPDEIEGHSLEVVMMTDSLDQPMTPGEVISYLKSNKKIKNQSVKKYPTIPTKIFVLPDGKDTLKWGLEQPYFLKNFLMFLDLVNVNQWERPIYFAVTIGKDGLFGLTDYFQLNGLSYKLVSRESEDSDEQPGEVDIAATFDNLMNKYEWNGIINLQSEEAKMGTNYRNIFHRLASALIKMNATDSAQLVLDRCVELFSNKHLRFDIFVIPLVEDYYRIEAFDKGDAIAKQVIFNLEENLKKQESHPSDSENSIEMWLAYAKRTINKYGRGEILEEGKN